MLISRLAVCLFSMFVLISKTYADTPDCVCHPAANPNLTQYVIGYGSLMQTASKNRTDSASGENKPVIIDHYQRGWYLEGLTVGLGATYLGVIADSKAHLNATIFSLASPSMLKEYDQREAYYCRVAVPTSSIHHLDSQPLPKGEFWIYVVQPKYLAKPSAKYPIVESYVDTFLSGCLEVEEKFHLQYFADECVKTTVAWSPHWVNDRIYPRRPFIFQPKAEKIDALLFKLEPTLFKQIKVES